MERDVLVSVGSGGPTVKVWEESVFSDLDLDFSSDANAEFCGSGIFLFLAAEPDLRASGDAVQLELDEDLFVGIDARIFGGGGGKEDKDSRTHEKQDHHHGSEDQAFVGACALGFALFLADECDVEWIAASCQGACGDVCMCGGRGGGEVSRALITSAGDSCVSISTRRAAIRGSFALSKVVHRNHQAFGFEIDALGLWAGVVIFYVVVLVCVAVDDGGFGGFQSEGVIEAAKAACGFAFFIVAFSEHVCKTLAQSVCELLGACVAVVWAFCEGVAEDIFEVERELAFFFEVCANLCEEVFLCIAQACKRAIKQASAHQHLGEDDASGKDIDAMIKESVAVHLFGGCIKGRFGGVSTGFSQAIIPPPILSEVKDLELIALGGFGGAEDDVGEAEISVDDRGLVEFV